MGAPVTNCICGHAYHPDEPCPVEQCQCIDAVPLCSVCGHRYLGGTCETVIRRPGHPQYGKVCGHDHSVELAPSTEETPA